MNNNPRILELNTRVWIKQFGEHSKISQIPDSQVDQWVKSGFNFIWLMGIWKTNKNLVEKYCFEPELVVAYNNALKDWQNKDVIGSPYSIDMYEIDPDLGNREELLNFKNRLNKKGIKLILDFVSNHLSAETSLIKSNKDIFLPGDEHLFRNDPYTFYSLPGSENEFFAHGRDPLFPPWKDTIQINFYSKEGRKFLINTLLDLTTICDGVRCDMAMLPLNNVFYNTWIGVIKKYGFERPQEEFWEEAISEVKSRRNDFIFLAETYWDLEWTLQNLGFDFTYDKKLTDRLVAGDVSSIRNHLNAEYNYQKKSIRFLENHDEDRAILKFGKERSLAAAVIISTIQGLVFYFDGQCEGKKTKLPVQLGREPHEKVEERISNFYKKLLDITKKDIFRKGKWQILEPINVGNNDYSFENILAWQWTLGSQLIIVAVNYNSSTSRCRLKFDLKSSNESIQLNDMLNDVTYSRSLQEISEKGLFVELKAYNSHIFLLNNE